VVLGGDTDDFRMKENARKVMGNEGEWCEMHTRWLWMVGGGQW
jgi:hypothetical protein